MASRVILLDLDGTVWNSYPWYGKLLATNGMKPAQLVRDLRSGHSVVAIAQRLGVSRTQLAKLCISAVEHLELYDGVSTTLVKLGRNGTLLAVVTSLPGWLVDPLLDHTKLASHFRTVVNASNCRAYKPSPRPIQQALTALDVAAGAQVLYVGDTANDALAARRAGVRFAWASYGYGATKPDGTDLVLDHFSMVATL
jgi:phosphoglycolate phosphatase